MKDKAFFDTNIIIYLYSEDEKTKKEKSKKLVNSTDVIISTQVLNELSSVLNKKFKLTFDNIYSVIEELSSNFDIKLITNSTILSALTIAQNYGYSYYDSLIISSALETKCTILYSEDMQHDQLINDQLKIKNPF